MKVNILQFGGITMARPVKASYQIFYVHKTVETFVFTKVPSHEKRNKPWTITIDRSPNKQPYFHQFAQMEILLSAATVIPS